MSRDLKNKVVLITGASSGFGEDSAYLFAREGALVVLTARREDRLNAIAEKIRSQGGAASVFPLDISDPRNIKPLIEKILEQHGRIDIVFNNAGFGKINFLENLDLERDIIPMVNLNLISAIEIVHQVLPGMISRGDGHIINMSSEAGWIGTTPYSVYAATKFGLRGFTDAIRREVSHFGVQVSGIYPGPATTEFVEHVGWDHRKANTEKYRIGSMTSEYVARKVVWLTKNPRQVLVLPWFFNVLNWTSLLLPWLTDQLIINIFTKRVYPKKGSKDVDS